MNINILDRNKNFNILLAGILSITIGLGLDSFNEELYNELEILMVQTSVVGFESQYFNI